MSFVIFSFGIPFLYSKTSYPSLGDNKRIVGDGGYTKKLFIYLEHKGTLIIHQEYVGNMPRDTLMDIEEKNIWGMIGILSNDDKGHLVTAMRH
jgi:hypothetical protein